MKGPPVLRRVENARLSYYPGALTGKGWLVFALAGRAMLVGTEKLHKREYAQLIQQQMSWPVYIVTVRDHNYWLFQGRFFAATDWLEAQQVHALLTTPHSTAQRDIA
jgi:hypothetical protein